MNQRFIATMIGTKSKLLHKRQDMQFRLKENLIAIGVIMLISLWVLLFA
jgi:hypothetical protein